MSIFYEPNAETEVHSRNLPHWCQQGRLYFVTFRLADSIPAERLEQLEAERDRWNECHPPPSTASQWLEYHRLFSERIDRWLDDGLGQCVLARPECGQIVGAALGHFEGRRYCLDHSVIMPNHVHVLAMPLDGHSPTDICHSWKSYSANKINERLGLVGQLWQHESFDHIVRSVAHLQELRAYIVGNAAECPQTALLSKRQIELA